MQASLICCSIIAVLLYIVGIYAIVILYQMNKLGKNSEERQTEFLSRRSKLFIIFALISLILTIFLFVGYALLVTRYDTKQISEYYLFFILFSCFFSMVSIITFVTGYFVPKWRNRGKRNSINKEDKTLGKEIIIDKDIETLEEQEIKQAQQEAEQLSQNQEAQRQMQKEAEWFSDRKKREYIIKKEQQEQEQRNAEAMRQMQKEARQRKAEQEQKQREWFWEQQRKEREEQERREQEKREREQKSIEYLNEHKYALIEKYSEAVFNFIEKLTENYPYLFLKMFKDTEIPMSSILIKPYYGKSQLLETRILFDGLQFTEAADSNMNKKIQGLTNFFIQGLNKRIKDNGDYDDEYTFPTLLYYIIRNNVVKYYRKNYIETYGYERLEEFCDNISNPFEQETANIKVLDEVLTISRYMSNNAIIEFVYYYIYKNDIELSFVDTYKKIVLEMKQIFEQKKKENLENDLFGKPKRKAIEVNDTPRTLSPIERIDRMTGEQFEIFMEAYFRKQGFKVERTPLSGDYGIDLIIENDFSKIGVQAKCYSNKVTASAVQEVVTGLRHYGLSGGMVVTNNYFQPAAIQLAKDNGITLWNRDKLIEKLKK